MRESSIFFRLSNLCRWGVKTNVDIRAQQVVLEQPVSLANLNKSDSVRAWLGLASSSFSINRDTPVRSSCSKGFAFACNLRQPFYTPKCLVGLAMGGNTSSSID